MGEESGSAATHGGEGGVSMGVSIAVSLEGGKCGCWRGGRASMGVYMQVWLSTCKSGCLNASLTVYTQVWLSTSTCKSGCLHVSPGVYMYVFHNGVFIPGSLKGEPAGVKRSASAIDTSPIVLA